MTYELFTNLRRISTERVWSHGEFCAPSLHLDEDVVSIKGSVNCNHISGERMRPMVTPTITESNVRLEIMATMFWYRKSIVEINKRESGLVDELCYRIIKISDGDGCTNELAGRLEIKRTWSALKGDVDMYTRWL